jgi:hypothetical protein
MIHGLLLGSDRDAAQGYIQLRQPRLECPSGWQDVHCQLSSSCWWHSSGEFSAKVLPNRRVQDQIYFNVKASWLKSLKFK